MLIRLWVMLGLVLGGLPVGAMTCAPGSGPACCCRSTDSAPCPLRVPAPCGTCRPCCADQAVVPDPARPTGAHPTDDARPEPPTGAVVPRSACSPRILLPPTSGERRSRLCVWLN